MAHARINRKGFLKGLGVAAAACAVRPASAAASFSSANSERVNTAAAELPRKTLAAKRIVAFRGPGI
jgi:hypothetical protein